MIVTTHTVNFPLTVVVTSVILFAIVTTAILVIALKGKR